LRLYSFGGYGLALAALALVIFGAYDSYPTDTSVFLKSFFLKKRKNMGKRINNHFLHKKERKMHL